MQLEAKANRISWKRPVAGRELIDGYRNDHPGEMWDHIDRDRYIPLATYFERKGWGRSKDLVRSDYAKYKHLNYLHLWQDLKNVERRNASEIAELQRQGAPEEEQQRRLDWHESRIAERKIILEAAHNEFLKASTTSGSV